jgi:AcrR family transcriptional regulator
MAGMADPAAEPAPQKESLVARRQRRVRRQLAQTALEMFSERGYDGTTVEDIVDSVEVSPSTFYRLFPSKSDLVLELHRIGMRDLVCDIAERPPDESLAEALDAAIMTRGEDIEADVTSIRHLQDLLAANPELRGRLLAELHDVQAPMARAVAPRLGSDPDDLRCQVVAVAIMSTTRMALDHWSTGTGTDTPLQVLRAALAELAPLFGP